MNKNNYCVIMAGGAGTRLWPISRTSCPKQFLEITGTGKTFLQHTFDRFLPTVPEENILVVTTDKYKSEVMKNLPKLRPENLLLEPYGRNTAPCITYVAYKLLKRNPNAAMVVSPSDHLVQDQDKFNKTIKNAFNYVRANNVLMTIGIVPTRPDTNYGYIQVTGGRAAMKATGAVKVKTFTEKPDKNLAQVFIDSGEFFWNAGIFVWTAQAIREELEKHLPEITNLFNGWENAFGSPAEQQFINRAYADCMNISIDYGVMEKTDRAWLYPASFRWADLGTWESLYEYCNPKDASGNVALSAKLLADDSNRNFIYSKAEGKLVAIKGLDNYVVIDTDDVLLVCPKDDKTFKEFMAGIGMPGYEKYR